MVTSRTQIISPLSLETLLHFRFKNHFEFKQLSEAFHQMAQWIPDNVCLYLCWRKGQNKEGSKVSSQRKCYALSEIMSSSDGLVLKVRRFVSIQPEKHTFLGLTIFGIEKLPEILKGPSLKKTCTLQTHHFY